MSFEQRRPPSKPERLARMCFGHAPPPARGERDPPLVATLLAVRAVRTCRPLEGLVCSRCRADPGAARRPRQISPRPPLYSLNEMENQRANDNDRCGALRSAGRIARAEPGGVVLEVTGSAWEIARARRRVSDHLEVEG